MSQAKKNCGEVFPFNQEYLKENIFVECTFFQNKFAKKWKTHSKKLSCFNTLSKQVAKI
jgi:hypothetical protein